ncbi:MAG: hypothetical protein AB1589_25585 [Cyanobacteriota bacterium]
MKQKKSGKEILLIWDNASYHREENLQQFLSQENEEKEQKDWAIACHFFAPYAPDENPV